MTHQFLNSIYVSIRLLTLTQKPFNCYKFLKHLLWYIIHFTLDLNKCLIRKFKIRWINLRVKFFQLVICAKYLQYVLLNLSNKVLNIISGLEISQLACFKARIAYSHSLKNTAAAISSDLMLNTAHWFDSNLHNWPLSCLCQTRFLPKLGRIQLSTHPYQ